MSCGVGHRRSSDPESGPRNRKKTKKKKEKERKKERNMAEIQSYKFQWQGNKSHKKKCMRNLFFREAIEAREQREICKWSERS